jgi:hypothetical protein
MNTDTEVVNDQVDTEGQTSQNEPQYSEIELRAMEQGWRPKEEWGGDEADFIDAAEFVRRRPLFEKIEHQSKEIKQLHRAFNAFKQHYTQVEKAAYERAIKDLKNQQKTALENGDIDTFQDIQDELEKARDQMRELVEDRGEMVETSTEVHPDFQRWVSRNPWYAKEDHMRVFADKIGRKYQALGMAPNDILREVEQEVRREFPHKFRNVNKDRAAPVESSSRGASGGRSKSEDIQLTDQERKIMNDLVRSKVLTKEEYIRDLKKARGIE